MFGKLMSISDDLMWQYYELLTDTSPERLAELRRGVEDGKTHPMEAKRALARRIVADFHDEEAADRAAEEFTRIFQERQAPSSVPDRRLNKAEQNKLGAGKKIRLARLLAHLKMAPSRTEAERLIKQGAVEIDGARVEDPRAELDLQVQRTFTLRVGKHRFEKVIVE
jgi:tyrosyl-tRNA synthetase